MVARLKVSHLHMESGRLKEGIFFNDRKPCIPDCLTLWQPTQILKEKKKIILNQIQEEHMTLASYKLLEVSFKKHHFAYFM